MCNIDVNDTYYITEKVENAYYCIPTAEDRQWDDLASRMGIVESHMGHKDPPIADPYKELFDVSNKKTDKADLSEWLELQAQAKTHNRWMKKLATGHVEDQQQSVQAEANDSKWSAQEMGPNEKANKMVTRHHGQAYSHECEYRLGTTTMMASITMLKRSDMWIADSGASNHVTFSGKGCKNRRYATGLTHRIVVNSVLPKCELDIPCVHFDNDGNQVGEVTITGVSHLPEVHFNLFSLTRLQKKGWTLSGNADYIKLQKRGELIVVQHCYQQTQWSSVCKQILQKRG